ncbi:MAG TPA: potassium transporter TrkG, partial [Prolixibacteraceae bacterium]|nr:potassium transporter TrkG [Prolixibacteraceae bacterium]
MNFRIIIRILGFLLIVEGVAMLLALAVALFYGGSDVPAFVFSSLLSLFIGTIAVLTTSHSPRQITKREGFVIVTLVWVVFSFFGTLPYLVSGSIPNLTNAFFETMSGFTTTGSTILNDIEALPNGILFWRSLTHWLGGMGIIVLSLAFLPLFGIGGIQLFLAEVPGPTPDKLSPKIQQTAIRLWGIYILFTAIEALLLWMGGMSLFDGVCHAFATMATGGFSTKQASVAFWPSPFIQYVIIFFMFLAGTNFSLLYVALKGNLKRLFHDEEFKYYLLFVLGFTIIIFSGLLITTTLGVEQAFRDALFQVVS